MDGCKEEEEKQMGGQVIRTMVAIATMWVTYSYEAVQWEGPVEEEEQEQERCQGKDCGLVAN